MLKPLIVLFLSLTLFDCNVNNENIDQNKIKLNRVCDSFMTAFSRGQYNEAMDLLRQNSVIEKEKIDTLLATIRRESINVFPAYGKINSYEFILERKIKDFVSKRFYILKFDKYPIKVDFTLYRSGYGWIITAFSYDSELVELL